MNLFINQDNTWVLWTFVVCWAGISIILEQKYKWAQKITGALIALLGAMILSNLKLIPTESHVYDSVTNYLVPIAIPLLLFKADAKKILQESGRMFKAFHISVIGVISGVFVATFLFSAIIPNINKIAGIITGSYIGGGVNFTAMTAAFNVPKTLTSATIVADNLTMVIYFFFCMFIPNISFFKNKFGLSNNAMEVSNDKQYWAKKEISLKDIATVMGVSMCVACTSDILGKYLANIIPTTTPFLSVVNSVLSNKYLLITMIMMFIATIFSKQFKNINGAEEIGTFLIYIFFVTLGTPATISDILRNGVGVLGFCLVVVLFNMIITLTLGKLFKFKLDELLLASNACIGGPTTAVAMAISKGWTHMVTPTMFVGMWGYILGNYAGIIIGNILSNI